MERIVVGMDGSARAAESLRWAVDEGRIRQVPISAVLVWSLLDQHHEDASVAFDPQYGREEAAAALDAYVAAALGDAVPSDLRKVVVCDRPASGLIEVAAETSLLVLGPRGLGGFKGLLLGSVSQACLHHARCPVAIVRPSAAAEDERARIVVGIDGSATSQRALDWAVDEARARRCSIEVVHAWSLPYAYGYPTPIPLDPTSAEEAAHRMVDAAIDQADASGLAAPIERTLIAGASPGGALLTRAEGAELVVVGSRGVGGVHGALLGSLAHQVAQHAPCTAVIVPPPSTH